MHIHIYIYTRRKDGAKAPSLLDLCDLSDAKATGTRKTRRSRVPDLEDLMSQILDLRSQISDLDVSDLSDLSDAKATGALKTQRSHVPDLRSAVSDFRFRCPWVPFWVPAGRRCAPN